MPSAVDVHQIFDVCCLCPLLSCRIHCHALSYLFAVQGFFVVRSCLFLPFRCSLPCVCFGAHNKDFFDVRGDTVKISCMAALVFPVVIGPTEIGIRSNLREVTLCCEVYMWIA
jgi:hypothetical protein